LVVFVVTQPTGPRVSRVFTSVTTVCRLAFPVFSVFYLFVDTGRRRWGFPFFSPNNLAVLTTFPLVFWFFSWPAPPHAGVHPLFFTLLGGVVFEVSAYVVHWKVFFVFPVFRLLFFALCLAGFFFSPFRAQGFLGRRRKVSGSGSSFPFWTLVS